MISLDATVLEVWKRLCIDLSDSDTCSTRLFNCFSRSLDRGIAESRAFNWPDALQYPPDVARRIIQVRDFGKRWVFADDLYTTDELAASAKQEFLQTQQAVITSIPQDQRTFLWLREARKVATEILGAYDEEEHNSCCRFGRKAAVGLPKVSAYLDNRFEATSGTKQQLKTFVKCAEKDRTLRNALRIINRNRVKLMSVRSLVATAVPKSYKANRLIMADSVLGGFISNGFGKVIENRLREKGLDIRRLQVVHKKLAQSASLSGALVTADMSKASDNISWPLLTRVLPQRWLRVIRNDRVRSVTLSKGTETSALTVMGMGKGYTFPLQTLMFYSLLQSIARLLGRPARISVYGDDLIYPLWMHRYVSTLFPAVGLKLNTDKTFATKAEVLYGGTSLSSVVRYKGCFRESCGGDYFCGIDVRPYMPKNEEQIGLAQKHTDLGYQAFLYKLLNSLIDKWGVWSIRRTVRYLLIEITSCVWKRSKRPEVLVVPRTEGIFSGCWEDHVPELELILDEFSFAHIGQTEIYPIGKDLRFGTLGLERSYTAIKQTRGRRIVPEPRVVAYFWQWLACRHDEEVGLTPDVYTDAPEVLSRIILADSPCVESWGVASRDSRTFGWTARRCKTAA